MKIYQHITDATSIKLNTGESLQGVTIEATGTAIGRIIFTKWSPFIEILSQSHGCVIQNCTMIGGTSGIECV